MRIAARANGRRGLKLGASHRLRAAMRIAARANGRRGLKRTGPSQGTAGLASPPVQTGGAD